MKRIALWAWLLLAAPLFGQTVTLPAEIKASPQSTVEVRAEGKVGGVYWYAATPGISVVRDSGDPFRVTVICWQAGTFTLNAAGADPAPGGKVVFGPTQSCRFVVGDAPPVPPGPGPGPGPGPNPPDPPPGPVTPAKLFVVVVEETAQAAAERGRLFADKAVNDRFKEKGHHWRIVDKDVVGPDGQPPADVRRFLDQAKGKAYPQVYLVNEQGKQLYAGDLPTKPDALLGLIEKVGG